MSFIDFLSKNYELLRPFKKLTISSIASHSVKVQKDSLFIALKGQRFDGHNYLKQAVEKGASVLLVEDFQKVPAHFRGPVFKYEKTLKTLPELLNTFYNFPSKKLWTVGVTGTNGKTSCCYLLKKIFKDCGWPTALMGTVDQHFLDHSWPSGLTTPSSVEIFERLNDFVSLEARACVMEVSSHALDQGRVKGIEFNSLIFTNLSQDHLDYHGTMENYFQSKKKLFLQALEGENKNFFSLFNQDDQYGRRLVREAGKPFFTFGQDSQADFHFQIKKSFSDSSLVRLQSSFGSFEFLLPLPGDFNVYNAVSALACAVLTGFKVEDCIKALGSFSGAPGRLQKALVGKAPFEVFIDYAHTPEALSSVLRALKTKGRRLIALFGCGGDRDQSKRALMVDKALQFADHIFFTTDNPRFEDPEQIAEQALKNLSRRDRQKVTQELDRKEAIKKALHFAQKGDLLIIAGKGHESFQLVQGQKLPFSDEKVILDCLKTMLF